MVSLLALITLLFSIAEVILKMRPHYSSTLRQTRGKLIFSTLESSEMFHIIDSVIPPCWYAPRLVIGGILIF